MNKPRARADLALLREPAFKRFMAVCDDPRYCLQVLKLELLMSDDRPGGPLNIVEAWEQEVHPLADDTSAETVAEIQAARFEDCFGQYPLFQIYLEHASDAAAMPDREVYEMAGAGHMAVCECRDVGDRPRGKQLASRLLGKLENYHDSGQEELFIDAWLGAKASVRGAIDEAAERLDIDFHQGPDADPMALVTCLDWLAVHREDLIAPARAQSLAGQLRQAQAATDWQSFNRLVDELREETGRAIDDAADALGVNLAPRKPLDRAAVIEALRIAIPAFKRGPSSEHRQRAFVIIAEHYLRLNGLKKLPWSNSDDEVGFGGKAVEFFAAIDTTYEQSGFNPKLCARKLFERLAHSRCNFVDWSR